MTQCAKPYSGTHLAAFLATLHASGHDFEVERNGEYRAYVSDDEGEKIIREIKVPFLVTAEVAGSDALIAIFHNDGSAAWIESGIFIRSVPETLQRYVDEQFL